MRLREITRLIGTAMIMTMPVSGQSLPNLFPIPNRSGLLETYNVNHRPISLTGAFFQPLGTNGRISERLLIHNRASTCQQCHGRSPPMVSFESLANVIRASSDPDPFNSADCRR
jgi:hypothetical protein